MTFKINWIKTPNGNAIKEGDTLRITNNKGFQGGIYQKGLPVLLVNGNNGSASIKIQRKGKSLKGLAALKLKDYDGKGITDAFFIQ